MVELTGLTKSQLREWCSVRQLLPPDIAPEGPGTHAMFTWQTAIALRVLKSIQDDWAGTVSAWAPVIRDFRAEIKRTSFPTLFGNAVIFDSLTSMTIQQELEMTTGPGILAVPLSPHLEVLATKLAIPLPDQLPLFPPMSVKV
nr:hypothetical protein [Aquicoccus sp. G2-2]MEA1113197.1 hypothetical protein [Aquicoccus sp. G2-2]